MNGADALVFTAGIGENQTEIREAICANLDQVGIVLDPATNRATRGIEAVIGAPASRVKVMVIPTNEELVVARETKRLLEQYRTADSLVTSRESLNTQHARFSTLSTINH
jgi:acetate kinase